MKLSTYVSEFTIKLTVTISSLSVTYFQLQFPLLICFYSMAERELNELLIFRFITCVEDELLNVNYVLKHSRDHADSEYVSYVGVDRKGTKFVGNKQTYE